MTNDNKLYPVTVFTPVKATDYLPENPGRENSVIIYNNDPTHRFVTFGFKNFDTEKPSLYFEHGFKSFLTVEGSGNNNSTFPVKNIEWLKEQQGYFFTREELQKLLGDAFTAGCLYELSGEKGDGKAPNEEKFIQSLFNK